jgi:hypothetical protein
MKQLALFLFATSLAMAAPKEYSGVIAKMTENEKTVILNITSGAFAGADHAKFPWLVIIAWKYEGGDMPSKEVNAKMIALEDAIDGHIAKGEHCVHAVSRTGNGLKEFEYYIKNQDDFIGRFNEALAGQERYPIQITFYSDPEWKELKRFMDMLKK